MAEVAGFFARVAPAEEADRRNQGRTELDEEFAAIEPIDRVIFQAGISEQAVPEKRGGGKVNGEMERLPKMAAAKMIAQVGSDNDKCHEVQRESAMVLSRGCDGEWTG